MLEIDDRYPEYARPYEPVKGRHRHGPLSGNESALMKMRRLRRLNLARRGFLTGVAFLIMLTILMPSPKPHFNIPDLKPAIIKPVQPKPKPKPEPTPIPDPEPDPDPYIDPTPTPDPDPEPDPYIDPTPTPDPEPDPNPDPDPKPKPKPKPKPDPDPKPDPEPDPEPIVKIAPSVVLDLQVKGPEPEFYEYPTLFFNMTLNDLKGGSATGRLYVDTGDGFYEPELNKTRPEIVYYDPAATTGDVWSSSIRCLIEPPSSGGISGKAKIIFDIVYPDGTTGKIETETRPIHTGSYVSVDTSYGKGGWNDGEEVDPVTGTTRYTITIDVIVDDSLAVPEEVTPGGDALMLSWPWAFYDELEESHYTDADGKGHLLYKYYSDTPFPNGEYWFAAEPLYKEDAYNSWDLFDFYFVFTKN